MEKVLLMFRMEVQGSNEKENEELAFVQYIESIEPMDDRNDALG